MQGALVLGCEAVLLLLVCPAAGHGPQPRAARRRNPPAPLSSRTHSLRPQLLKNSLAAAPAPRGCCVAHPALINPTAKHVASPGKLQLQLLQAAERGQLHHSSVRHLSHALQEKERKKEKKKQRKKTAGLTAFGQNNKQTFYSVQPQVQ